MKETGDFIVAVVDAKQVLNACGIQAVSGLLFEAQDPDYVAHKSR